LSRLYAANDRFAKTGSRQAYEKLRKRVVFFFRQEKAAKAQEAATKAAKLAEEVSFPVGL